MGVHDDGDELDGSVPPATEYIYRRCISEIPEVVMLVSSFGQSLS